MCKTLRKTWKRLRKVMWENCEKFSPFLLKCSVCDLIVCIMFGFHKIFHKIINMFYTLRLFGFNLFYWRFCTVST